MAGETLQILLQQFSLENFYDTFTSVGIQNTTHLLALTMQDYPTLGITSMQDRRKMFHLIQNIKGEDNTRQAISTGYQFAKKNNKEITKQDVQSDKELVQTPAQQKTPSIRNHKLTTPNMHNFSYGVPSSKMKSSISRPKVTNENSNIKVCVRKRPLGQNEVVSGESNVVDVEVDNDTVVINAKKVAVDLTKYMQKFTFVFDEVFDENSSNHQVYEKTAKPLVNAIFTEGVKATCFAYGCTGSGKTYTMLGTDNVPGLYLLAASDIFNILYSGNHGDGLGLWVSFYEIYCGQLFDLLNERSKLFARENASHQVCIVGLTEKQVNNVEELMEVIESGGNARSTGSTGVNADSSRSHAILQLELKPQQGADTLGRFSFIDLAGSERAADVTDSDKQTRMEGAEINQSLLALKECIRSLDQDSKHTPFRQSKLTQVLKDSFVGNTRTCMIANVSPCLSSCENTLNTLRYADRVKELNKTLPDIVSSRPVTVHGNPGKDNAENHTTRITNNTRKHKTLQSSKQVPLKSCPETTETTSNSTSVPMTRKQTPIRTPRINSKSRRTEDDSKVLKSLQIPSNTPRNASLLTRPETSPAIIKEITNKPRTRSRLQYINKEQSYNMLKTNHQPLTKENTSTDNKPIRQKSRFSDRTTSIQQVSSNEDTNMKSKDDKSVQQKSRFSEKRITSNQVNKLQVLSNENRIVKKQDDKTTRQQSRLSDNRTVISNTQRNQKVLSAENIIEPTRNDMPVTPRFSDKRSGTSSSQKQSLNHGNIASKKKITANKPSTKKSNILKLDTEEVLSSHDLHNKGFKVGNDDTAITKQVVDGVVFEEKIHKEQKYSKTIDHIKSPPDNPQTNNRYSKGIKARLAQLFNSKTTTNTDMLPGHQEVLTAVSSSSRSNRTPLQSNQRTLNDSLSNRVITEDQIVASHHTQLAMVTGLCHEEMVLLKQQDKTNQDFTEYVAQLEEILLQKQACIQTLQEKLRNWKASSH